MDIIIPPLHQRGGVYCFTSVRPSFHLSVRPKIFFVAFFSSTIDGRNLIFGHKLHIGMPYCGKRFWTRQIPTSCLPTQLVFIHIEHICGGIISEHQLTIRLVILPLHRRRGYTVLPLSVLPSVPRYFLSHFSQQLLMAEI